MYVKNIAEYNFAFNYRGKLMIIPFDGKIWSIPDDSGEYKELKIIPSQHIRKQEVTFLKKDGEISSGNLRGHQRRGRPPVDRSIKKGELPLKNVRISDEKRESLLERLVDDDRYTGKSKAEIEKRFKKPPKVIKEPNVNVDVSVVDVELE